MVACPRYSPVVASCFLCFDWNPLWADCEPPAQTHPAPRPAVSSPEGTGDTRAGTGPVRWLVTRELPTQRGGPRGHPSAVESGPAGHTRQSYPAAKGQSDDLTCQSRGEAFGATRLGADGARTDPLAALLALVRVVASTAPR